jgi:hypothetical protein
LGQRQLERKGRDEATLGGALLYALEGNEPGKQFADFGGRLPHGWKVARQLLRNRGSRRFANG